MYIMDDFVIKLNSLIDQHVYEETLSFMIILP